MALLDRTMTVDSPETRAASGELSGDDYMSLVRSKDVGARAAAAARSDAPLGALLCFAQDPKVDVRIAVAGNTAIGRTTTVVAHLSGDKSADVIRALIDNPSLTQDALLTIATDGPRGLRAVARERLSVEV